MIDGDTIEISGERIRLVSVDAPESRQSREAAEAIARKFLERVRIGNQADKFPAQLSGG